MTAVTRETIEPFTSHRIGCAITVPLPEPWLSEPCTCPNGPFTYGAHNVGCRRSAAFVAFRAKVDAEPRPDCDCGLDAILAALR
jgi:hypothetical protein